MGEAVVAVEAAFGELAAGRAQMPAKVYLDFPEHHGDLRIMPAALGKKFAGVKLVNSHPENPARGLPTVIGTYLLFSQETGMPLCLMGATALTGIRTGAASGVASKYLARSNSTSVGLIGAGVQAGYQLQAVAEVLKIARVKVWAPLGDSVRRDKFIAWVRASFPGVSCEVAGGLDDAVDCDVVCTTTPSRSPIVEAAMVRAGTHINAIGADGPGKQELDPQILRQALVIVDDMHQAVGGGEINVGLSSKAISIQDIGGSLTDLIAGRIKGRTSDAEITVFDSTGLAIQDIALAELVYERALAANTGTILHL